MFTSKFAAVQTYVKDLAHCNKISICLQNSASILPSTSPPVIFSYFLIPMSLLNKYGILYYIGLSIFRSIVATLNAVAERLAFNGEEVSDFYFAQISRTRPDENQKKIGGDTVDAILLCQSINASVGLFKKRKWKGSSVAIILPTVPLTPTSKMKKM